MDKNIDVKKPYIMAVVGERCSGKTTFIKSHVYLKTRQEDCDIYIFDPTYKATYAFNYLKNTNNNVTIIETTDEIDNICDVIANNENNRKQLLIMENIPKELYKSQKFENILINYLDYNLTIMVSSDAKLPPLVELNSSIIYTI